MGNKRIQINRELCREIADEIYGLIDVPVLQLDDVKVDAKIYVREYFSSIEKKISQLFSESIEFESELEREISREPVEGVDSRFASEYRDLFRNPDVYVFGHGTGEDVVEKIMEEGLEAKSMNIDQTMIPMGETQTSFNKIMNWPHRGYKHIVLVGLQDIDIVPIWEELNRENPYGYDNNFKLPNEYIIGYIDVKNQRIVNNPNYLERHNYSSNENRVFANDAFGSLVKFKGDEEERIYNAYKNISYLLGRSSRREDFSSFAYNALLDQVSKSQELLRAEIDEHGITEEEYLLIEDTYKIEPLGFEDIQSDIDWTDPSWGDFETNDEQDSFSLTGQEIGQATLDVDSELKKEAARVETEERTRETTVKNEEEHDGEW